jgi:hypothetical protein
MLYWICPECGHECSPAIRECPTCTAPPESAARHSTVQESLPIQEPAAERVGVSQELLSLAQNFQASAAVGLLASPATSMVAVEEAVEPPPQEPPKELPEPELFQKLAPLENLALNPARPGRSELMELVQAPVPVPIASPAVSSNTELPRLEFALQPAGLAAAGEVRFRAARSGQRKLVEQRTEPMPLRRQSVAFVRVELPRTDRSGMVLGDLAQLDTTLLKPVVPHPNGQPKDDVSTALAHEAGGPSFVSCRVEVASESLAELQTALKISGEELDRDAIQAIQESFREQPAVGLLAPASEIVTAPAPPAAQWMPSQKPKFTPIAPEHAGRGTVIAGPQAPPLAGPSLPPQLLNFDHQNSSLRKRKRASWWPVSLIVATVVILGAASLLHFGTQDPDTKAITTTVAAQSTKSAPAPQAFVVQEHPAARSVEVAGIRIVTGANKRPQLQFIVINHSANELTGLNIRIAVRSVEALEDPPLFSVSSMVASLGPNQSKEIHTDLDPSVKPSAIPDWQSLRTEVLVARP